MSTPYPHLICMAIHRSKPHLIAKNSIKDVCSICAAEVWRSPSSEELIAKHGGATILCDECFLAGNPSGPIEIPAPTPAQFEEMRETFGWPKP